MPAPVPSARALALAATWIAVATGVAALQDPGPGQADPLARYDLDGDAESWRLPNRLVEVSGLAVSPDGRLFAHDDERAVIYEVDLVAEELAKGFAMGDRVARGDFEGIAIARDRFYLVTSDGRLYESLEGADDDRMLFNTFGTGVGRACEVEGLAHEPADDTLLLLCKTARVSDLEGTVTLFRWSLASRTLVDPPLRVPVADIERATDQRGFAASGVERDPATGVYLLISAQDRAIVSVDRAGNVLSGARLDRDRHEQAEGISIDRAGRLLIADEGRDGRARITAYAPLAREDRRP